jgi:hypothetical protein
MLSGPELVATEWPLKEDLDMSLTLCPVINA